MGMGSGEWGMGNGGWIRGVEVEEDDVWLWNFHCK